MKEKRRIGLTSKIFISLLLGAILGLVLHYFIPESKVKNDILIDGILYVVGNGFLRLMQMLVVPLVFSSLITGSMSMGDSKKIGTVGVKTLIFYLVTTAFAITVALMIGNVMNPGTGLNMEEITTSETTIVEKESFAETVLNFIPTNPIKSLAEGNMLQIILFAIIIGVILAKLGESAATVSNFFSQFNDVMMEMTVLVMKVAPFGVLCLIARTFSGIGLEALLPLFKYVITVLIALAVQCFLVYLAFLKVFTGLNPIIFIKKFMPVMGFAFSTATSNATIPMSIDVLANKLGVSKKISSFTIPLGATINMDGTAIMQGVAVVFASQAFHITLTPMDYLTVISTATLASIGTAGVPGVGLITLSMVFNSVGLPIEGIALIMGIDRILDMTRTAVNVAGDAVCTTIVASQGKLVNEEIYYDRQVKDK